MGGAQARPCSQTKTKHKTRTLLKNNNRQKRYFVCLMRIMLISKATVRFGKSDHFMTEILLFRFLFLRSRLSSFGSGSKEGKNGNRLS